MRAQTSRTQFPNAMFYAPRDTRARNVSRADPRSKVLCRDRDSGLVDIRVRLRRRSSQVRTIPPRRAPHRPRMSPHRPSRSPIVPAGPRSSRQDFRSSPHVPASDKRISSQRVLGSNAFRIACSFGRENCVFVLKFLFTCRTRRWRLGDVRDPSDRPANESSTCRSDPFRIRTARSCCRRPAPSRRRKLERPPSS